MVNINREKNMISQKNEKPGHHNSNRAFRYDNLITFLILLQWLPWLPWLHAVRHLPFQLRGNGWHHSPK